MSQFIDFYLVELLYPYRGCFNVNTEINDLRKIICFRKYEDSVDSKTIPFCNAIENLAVHGIHSLPCSHAFRQ